MCVVRCRPTLFLSLVSSLSLHDGLRSCRSVESPVRLAFDAIEEVEPEVTAAAAAAIEVDVGKAVMEDAAEEDLTLANEALIGELFADNCRNYRGNMWSGNDLEPCATLDGLRDF